MTIYQYKAASRGGEVLQDEMEAESQQAVVRWLHGQGHIPIRAEEATWSVVTRRDLNNVLHRCGLTRRDISEFTLELATLLEAGVSLDKALEMLAELSEKETKRKMLSRLHAEVRNGASLSHAMESEGATFTPFFRNMVKAGEATGALDVALERLAEFMDRSRELREAVVSATIYPLILVIVACISLAVILGFVVPRISEMFDQAGQTLPWFTQVVVATGSFVQHYGWALALAIAGGGFYLRRRLRNPTARLRWDRWLLRLPLVGDLIAKLETARFTRTLGTLLGGGVSLLDALLIAKGVIANQAVATGIDGVAERARQGEGLARPLQEADVLPRLVGRLLQVGEETGSLEKMLLRLGGIHEREVQTVLRRLMAIIEPVLILGLAVVIAGIIMSIVVAIFNVNNLAF